MPPDPDNDVYDFREGFDTRLIDMNRTCKVTKGGHVVKYTAMVACGNYNGVIGFAKVKGPSVPVALQKDIIQSMPHDAHPMGVLVNSMSALSIFHPDANPALRVLEEANLELPWQRSTKSYLDEPRKLRTIGPRYIRYRRKTHVVYRPISRVDLCVEWMTLYVVYIVICKSLDEEIHDEGDGTL
ncbi:hypothetical protein Fmac_010693 [Flemingia macrophylla]|uniref:S5 DRBM domain-containing protein n=1 Tax=Flemingia macrophylla TaxID=520843 RepID=A0ABD1MKB1_9FABA